MKLVSVVATIAAAAATVRAAAFHDPQVVFSNDAVLSPVSNDFEGLQDFTLGKFSLLSLHKQLIELDSTSNHEGRGSQFLKTFLESYGLTVELQKIHDQFETRYNVYAYLGKTRDTKVVLTSHIDTVPPYIPYKVDGTKIYGRGSSDAKGSVATQIAAFLSLVHSGDLKEGDVSLLYVVGEEISGVGMSIVDQLGVKWETGIFGEPTELKLGVGHKGYYIFQLTADGKAAHSGYPHLGVSASEILLPALNKLLDVQWPASDLLGPSTLNIGQFSGGLALNVIPAHAEARAFIRVAADVDEIDRLVHEAIDPVANLKLEVLAKGPETHLDYEVPGFDLVVLAYSTDIPHLKVPLKKRYLYGPGTILVAHSDHEYVENSDLIDSIGGYQKLIKYAVQN
ncbi:Zn-dependent exopeptidase [Suhomyces tanzawaensis NRRL Y-17324]|uniref:Zn-dependent exopeptidase n=1 Tax=Suhomyces tanzawaensis NRRL Y-17324 TaxID=984487 RepID=A0A1E4SK20_9ASCO|nr:Zn-dependent exopeptidase [Suhomyces tanzawaensis NRRL Y-17324]ODV79844.1 Zn-dependent exopeptidase [Suhomyces tanzawaensis NRRL Y-17324]